MQAYLNRIDGLEDAVLSMYYSKRSVDREYELKIRNEIRACQNLSDPSMPLGAITELSASARDRLEKMFKWGRQHITMLRFVDLSFTVYGLHRGGQDDWDAHSYRFQNRIIRASTRIRGSDFRTGELSEWYQGKILPTDMALAALGIVLPDEITGPDGNTYVRAANGYILKGHEDEADYKRGLYMLSIPSDFIFRIQLLEFCHVFRERNLLGTASPEVKIACESMGDQTVSALAGLIDKDWLRAIRQ